MFENGHAAVVPDAAGLRLLRAWFDGPALGAVEHWQNLEGFVTNAVDQQVRRVRNDEFERRRLTTWPPR